MNETIKQSSIFTIKLLFIFTIILFIPYILSGTWPPFVTIISDSMEPNMEKGDVVFIVDNERYSDADSIHGVSTKNKGDVIVYSPDGNDQLTPIIHRALYYTEKGEDWTDNINNSKISSEDCSNVSNCPAPHSGFITAGDSNDIVDQDSGISEPVKEEWIIGRTEQRIPEIGWIRISINSIL